MGDGKEGERQPLLKNENVTYSSHGSDAIGTELAADLGRPLARTRCRPGIAPTDRPGTPAGECHYPLSVISDETQSTVHTVSTIGPDELPPPYQSAIQGGMPMVTCRVCQAMIDISGKRDQHVVKCCQCNEATVCFQRLFLLVVCLLVHDDVSC